jgi:anti-sigma regulatory factor (Ser/Thr protein kinase)
MSEPSRRSFPPQPAAVREVRRFVRESLGDQLDADHLEDLELVASELATNAVTHAGTPFDIVVATDGLVRIDVYDGARGRPVKRPPSTTATSGRGMQIVDQLCDRWGVHDAGSGKCVWCEKDLD